MVSTLGVDSLWGDCTFIPTLKIRILRSSRRLFIILVSLTMTWCSENTLIFKVCRHGLMPNLIRKFRRYLIQQHSFFHLVDRVELFINLSDCQIVRFRHIGGGRAAAAGHGRRWRERPGGWAGRLSRAVGPDSSEAAEAEAGWPLRLLPLPCGSWRMRSLLRWLINQFQLLVEQCSQSLKLTQYVSKG